MRFSLLLWEKRNHILSLVKLGIGLVMPGTFLAISAAPLTRRGALKVNRIEMRFIAFLQSAFTCGGDFVLWLVGLGVCLFVSVPRSSFRF